MGKYAFLFPGQGSQYVGMGKNLRDNFIVAADVFEMADEALKEKLSDLCFHGPVDDLNLTMNTQPAILAVSVAALRVVQQESGIAPVMVGGHSLGEFSALVAAGVLQFADALRLVRKRGTFMQEAVPVGIGGMAAILGMDAAVVERICNESAQGQIVAPANYNSPGQVVISGHVEAVARVAEKAVTEGAKMTKILPVSAPFHSLLMEKAARRFAAELDPIELGDMDIPVLSNVTADFYPSKSDVKTLLTEQLTHPVRWHEEMDRMLECDIDGILELGPGKVLRGIMRRISQRVPMKHIENCDTLKIALSGMSTGT